MAPCKFFAQGRCTYGPSCKNSHEAVATPESWRSSSALPTTQSTTTSQETAKISETGSTLITNTCWFYSQGKCTYGAACRLSHEAALPNVNQLPVRASGVKTPAGAFLPKELCGTSPVVFVSGALHDSNRRPPQLSADVPSFTPSTRVISESSAAREKSNILVCIFYSRGFCRYGETCPFRHEAPTPLHSHTPSKEDEQKISVSSAFSVAITSVNTIRMCQMMSPSCPSALLSRRCSTMPVSHSKEAPKYQMSNFPPISQPFKS